MLIEFTSFGAPAAMAEAERSCEKRTLRFPPSADSQIDAMCSVASCTRERSPGAQLYSKTANYQFYRLLKCHVLGFLPRKFVR